MAVRVVILRQGSPHILQQWDEEDASRLLVEEWVQGSCLWPSGLLNSQPEPLEIFLCLDGETLADGYDAPFLSRVIQQAHSSMWAARVYVVVDKTLLLTDQKQFRASREKWFEMLLNNDVCDVLEWEVNPGKWERRLLANLNEASARSEARAAITLQPPGGVWKCLLYKPPEEGSEQASFLSRYLIRSVRQTGGDKCLVVLPATCDDNALRYVRDEVLAHLPNDKVMVGVIDQVEEPPQRLKELCLEKHCQLVWFHGLFELYYFLQRLNEDSGEREEALTGATRVQVISNPVFKAHEPRVHDVQTSRILITHSYVPSDESGCRSAADDAWRIVNSLPGRVSYEIYPAVECDRLPDILHRLRHVLAWIHIGHGDSEKGLQQANGLFKKPEVWLNGFAAYESSLPLVLFSSCLSEEPARRFAEAGAGFAIGYANKVYKPSCVLLTLRVVEAALASNGAPDMILKAFLEGRKLLSIRDPDALPVAFRSKR
jgi:hypothetical protein